MLDILTDMGLGGFRIKIGKLSELFNIRIKP